MGATFHSFCFCHIGSCREVLTGSWFARNKVTLRDFVLYVCNRHRWLHPWASEKFTTKFSPLLWAVWELSLCGRCTAPSREPSAYHILRELRLLFFLDAVCSIYDYCSALRGYWITFWHWKLNISDNWTCEWSPFCKHCKQYGYHSLGK